MNPSTHIIIGAGGWLGSAIASRLPGAILLPAASVLDGHGTTVLAAAAAGTVDPVVLNAAGATSDPAVMPRFNAELPERLADFCQRRGLRLVHLGSAAEYGTPSPDGRLFAEGDACAPTSDYGMTKLAGSLAVLGWERGTVLRIFNVVSRSPKPGSPLADIRRRIRLGLWQEQPVEVLSAETRRDTVSLDFVVDSASWALEHDAPGLFNVCSGAAPAVGDIVQAALVAAGSELPVVDLAAVPATTIGGDPALWTVTSGLREQLSARRLAAILMS